MAIIKDEFRDVKNLYIAPARCNGKSLYQAALYPELLKGDKSNMDWSKFIKSNGGNKKDKVEQIDIPDPAPNVPEEEWIWIKGYKGTDKNMCCRDYQYELDRQHDFSGDEIKLCYSGFHFCKDLGSVFQYYDIGNGNRFFEVEALVKKSEINGTVTATISVSSYNPYNPWPRLTSPYVNDDKHTAKSIRFIRELTAEEVFTKVKRHRDIRDWTIEQKEAAMRTSITAVFTQSRIEKLIDLGYSEAFARYIADHDSRYEIAVAVGSQPDLSMDVKVMTIFCLKV